MKEQFERRIAGIPETAGACLRMCRKAYRSIVRHGRIRSDLVASSAFADAIHLLLSR